jgi:molybdopterin molybdotransferase
MVGLRRLMRAVVSFEEAIACVDAASPRLGTERVRLNEAMGRVLAEEVRAATPIPPDHRAALDGFAVRADGSLGASTYNPVELPLLAVTAGAALPLGADAVIPLDAVDLNGLGHVQVVEPVAPGDNVERQGAVAAAGALLVATGVRLGFRHIGMLAAAETDAVQVVRRPRVHILLAGSTATPQAPDSNGPMLRAAVERDGGVIAELTTLPRARSSLNSALTAANGDLVLVIGGTGPGPDDHAAAAVGDLGELVFHGVTVRPGETAGFGRTASDVPAMLLPGTPAAALWSYELFAGRAIRRLGGRNPGLPYRSREMTVARKIVSAIGMTEICPVLLGSGDTVEPVPAFAEIGLRAAIDGAGFVIVPAAREGYPPGAVVTAYLYDDV